MTEADFLKADNRIHCVFYFIGPHRMKMLDREFIAQLSPLVPIIPVIAKADTMTVRERNEYLHIVKIELDKISERLGESCIYDFGTEDLKVLVTKNVPEEPLSSRSKAVQQEMERLPNLFAVVCDLSNERVYPWGTLRIDDNKHSDFRRLQTVLFESGKLRSSPPIINYSPPLFISPSHPSLPTVENHLKGLIDNTRLKTIRLCGKTKPKAVDNLDHHFSIRLNVKN